MKWLNRTIWLFLHVVWLVCCVCGAVLRLLMMCADLALEWLGWWITWHLDRAEFRIGRGSSWGVPPSTPTSAKDITAGETAKNDDPAAVVCTTYKKGTLPG